MKSAGIWQITITRLDGKPAHRLKYSQVRSPILGEVAEWPTHDGKTIKAKIGYIRHFAAKERGNLGVWDIKADEVA
jgi:hypothetical protein